MLQLPLPQAQRQGRTTAEPSREEPRAMHVQGCNPKPMGNLQTRATWCGCPLLNAAKRSAIVLPLRRAAPWIPVAALCRGIWDPCDAGLSTPCVALQLQLLLYTSRTLQSLEPVVLPILQYEASTRQLRYIRAYKRTYAILAPPHLLAPNPDARSLRGCTESARTTFNSAPALASISGYPLDRISAIRSSALRKPRHQNAVPGTTRDVGMLLSQILLQSIP
ncbi:hypothetical protein TARUN_8982 [Trichoderma arundinaceum]|uniref:Uncharacterized protein n=1 Tax=Trichoderma arundinaceum TaxID=490622 RepID=A0A395NBK1_TRIAR|nr:hypothetical protein TARUN_8982 [Trichoderma arundinaceum]